jgi:hypothetical protein
VSVLHGVARGLALILAAAAAGCGEEERFTPERDHAAEVAGNPYALTCGDIAGQSRSTTSQELVIEAEFALADAPVLRRRVAAMTENRVGRSIYWAMTEICRRHEPSYTPGEEAVEAVRRGKYLVQPRPEAWNRAEPPG